MSKIHISMKHGLTQKEATKRIKKLLEEVKDEYGDQIKNLKEKWSEDTGTFSFSALGFDVAGTIQVMQKNVELTGDLPFALTFFKNKIKKTIQDRAKKLLKEKDKKI